MMEERRAALRLVLASLTRDEAMVEQAVPESMYTQTADGRLWMSIDLLMAVLGYAHVCAVEANGGRDQAIEQVRAELLRIIA